MRAVRLFRPAEMPCSGRAPRHARHIGGRALAKTRAAAAWPVTAHAQQPAMPVVEFLGATSPEPYASVIAAFRKGLNEASLFDGRDVAIEYRWAEEQYDRMPALADDRRAPQVSSPQSERRGSQSGATLSINENRYRAALEASIPYCSTGELSTNPAMRVQKTCASMRWGDVRDAPSCAVSGELCAAMRRFPVGFAVCCGGGGA